MQLNPYLYFDGQCAEAFRTYERCLGGRIEVLLTHRETPAAETTAPEWQDKIIHGRIRIGDALVLASDAPPGHYTRPAGYSVTLRAKTAEEAERVFRDLGEGGTVTAAMAETFFASRFGMLTDRFGIPWMVLCEKAP